MRFILIMAVFYWGISAFAGLMEISYTYSTRNSFIDSDNFQKSYSHTGSFAWYFTEMSALELSYTKGKGEVSGRAPGDNFPLKYITQFAMYDTSLILTFASKESFFQPYVKGGAAWVDKKIYRDDQFTKGTLMSNTDKNEAVPSWGVGLRFFITKGISIRVSYDRWRSGNSGDNKIWDEAVRGGLSFMF